MRKSIIINKKYFQIKCLLLWFIGFNATLNVLRYAAPVIMHIYIVSIIGLAVIALLNEFHGCAEIKPSILLRVISYILAILVSLTYSIDFFKKNISACSSIILILIYMSHVPDEEERNSFLQGYKSSLLITFFYSGVQWILIHTKGINTTELVLKALHYNRDFQLSMDRITGLNWDPYLLGIFCATGYFLFSNKWLRMYIVVLSLLCGSRSGLTGFTVAFLYVNRKKIFTRSKITIALVMILAIFIVIVPRLNFSRGFSKDSYGYRRIEYISLLPDVEWSDGSIIRFIFGGAPAYSGARFYYSQVDSLVNDTTPRDDWSIESDWLGVLYGRGVFGVISYFYFYYYLYRKCRGDYDRAIILTILFAGIGYYYDSAIFINLLVYEIACCDEGNNYSRNHVVEALM